MTADTLYFGRSEYTVLPESRTELVDEHLLAFSKLQKFCQSLITLQLLYCIYHIEPVNLAKTFSSSSMDSLSLLQNVHRNEGARPILWRLLGRFQRP